MTHSPLTGILKFTSFEKNPMSEVIRFNHLYRDSGNWKKFGSKLFSNPDQLTIEEIKQKIRQNLIDQEYFSVIEPCFVLHHLFGSKQDQH